MFDRFKAAMAAFAAPGGGNPSFEAAGHGRRLRGFNPSRAHINAALEKSGPTLLARARWLYENDGYAGNAVDEWASAAVGDGIKPRPQFGNAAKKKETAALFWRWAEEADADGVSDFYGLQERIAREVFLAGEVFVRIRDRRRGDMRTVPFQLQMLPSEMLDISFNDDLGNGGYIRAGIEFNAIGKREAYHFWRWHPNDARPANALTFRERVRVPADRVLHIFDGKQGGQIRGVPRVARALVKMFGLEMYDDAELDRKKTAALFAGFLKGRGEYNPVVEDEDEDSGDDEIGIGSLEPGAIVDLGMDRDIAFSSPVDVGGSYEPFQYRNLLKICAGLGMPYAVVTGDVTRGNFSNVRTAIINFRRRVGQWQHNTMVFQFCRPVWQAFIERAVMAGKLDLPDYDADPVPYWYCEWLPQAMEWVDPIKDVQSEKEQIKAGLKSRTQAIAERGYDREQLDDEIEQERKDAKKRGLKFDTDAGGASAKSPAPGAQPMDDADKEDEAESENEKESGNEE